MGVTHLKKLAINLLIIIIVLTCLYDLKSGALKLISIDDLPKAEASAGNIQKENTLPNKEITVEPGDTVLSIIERLNPHTSENITKMINDFKQLNPKQNPNDIKIGKSYLFPKY